MSSAIPPVVAVSATCPICDSPIRIRHAKRDGSAFLGCTGYPRCTWTAPHSAVEQELAKELLAVSDLAKTLAHLPRSNGSAVTEKDIRSLLSFVHPDRNPSGKIDAHEIAIRLTDLLTRARADKRAA